MAIGGHEITTIFILWYHSLICGPFCPEKSSETTDSLDRKQYHCEVYV